MCVTLPLATSPPTEGHQGCSRLSLSQTVSMSTGVLQRQIPRSDFEGKGYSHLHDFQGYPQAAFHKGGAILPSPQRCLKSSTFSTALTMEMAALTCQFQNSFHPQTGKGRENKSFSKEEFEQAPGVATRHLPQKHLRFLEDVSFSPPLLSSGYRHRTREEHGAPALPRAPTQASF